MAKNDLLKKEDWLAVWIGFIVIAIGAVSVLTGWFDFSAAKFKTWSCGEDLKETQIYNNVKLAAEKSNHPVNTAKQPIAMTINPIHTANQSSFFKRSFFAIMLNL